MKVKVHCSCGAKFEFEVEPLNGHMPVRINCPTCGIDATSFADSVIQQQLQAPASAAPRIRIHSQAPPAQPVATSIGAQGSVAPPTPGSGGLKISRPGSAPALAPEPPVENEEAAELAAAAQEEQVVEYCHRHKNDIAIEHCLVCGKPICSKCMEQFGHVCSIFCREAAPHHNIHVPEYSGQRGVAEARSARLTSRLIGVAVVIAVLLVLAWGWYRFFGRDPKEVTSILFPKSETPYFSLLAPGQLFSLKKGQASLQNLNSQQSLWTTPLDSGSDFEPTVLATSNDIWIASPNKLYQLDRQSGARKELALPENLRQVIPGQDSFLLVSGTATGHARVTQVSIADGGTKNEEVSISSAQPAATRTVPNAQSSSSGRGASPTAAQQLQSLAARSSQREEPAAPTAGISIAPFKNGFFPDNPNGVQFQSRLIEQRTVTHETMKKKPGSSVLDNANVTASQGLDLANEMLNESRRQQTGGVQFEDVSRYQVTLHRLFSPDSTDWSGEVTGPPGLLALKAVDLVIAGTNLLVFDKNNKKLWDAKLTFTTRYVPPVLETADSLYFADRGTLTRFDLKSGNVRWRLPSVGISQIISDPKGAIYISTTTAGPDSIQYSDQVDLRQEVKSVIARVDPDKGVALWSNPFDKSDYQVFTSGKFLYITCQFLTQDALRLEDGPDNQFFIKLLYPSSGDEIWRHVVHGRVLVKAETQDNWILLQFTDQAQILKFFSL